MTSPEPHWLPIRFRDVDVFGHVYHAELLSLLDEARRRYVRCVLRLEDPDYVIARIEIDYVSSVVLDEARVGVTTTVERVGTSSLTFAETLVAPDGRVVARARVVVVLWVVAERRSRRLSEAERAGAEARRTPSG